MALQVQLQPRKMKETLQHIENFEIHAPDFGCFIDGGSNSPFPTDQELPTGPETLFSPDIESIMDCLHSLIYLHLNKYHPFPFNIH